jgi:hypothetical protein
MSKKLKFAVLLPFTICTYRVGKKKRKRFWRGRDVEKIRGRERVRECW